MKDRTYYDIDKIKSVNTLFDFKLGRYGTGRAYALSKLKEVSVEEERWAVVEPQQASFLQLPV